ncbi:MAG: SPOR domain-containing protein [Flavobacteriaceae bacterium]|nr:MAG: SPOR domain-containing protein [Flavobacteriaceae bacterium]
MKKVLMILMLCIPFGLYAQELQDINSLENDLLNSDYADNSEFFERENESEPGFVRKEKKFLNSNWMLANEKLFRDNEFDLDEGMVTFTSDKKTVFFSVNRKIKKGKDENKQGVKTKKSVHLQLFKASVNEDGTWQNLEMLPVNGNRFSTGQPALNNDDSVLYFVSDRPEALGRTDIFKVDLNEDGTYGELENLGPTINSIEREIFPEIDSQNVLYFSSDVHSENGELNVYASKIFEDKMSKPIQLDVAKGAGVDAYADAYNEISPEEADQIENVMNIGLNPSPQNQATLNEPITENNSQNESNSIMEVLETEVVPENKESLKYDFEGNKKVFTVQIGAFKGKAQEEKFTRVSNLFDHAYQDGFQRYYSGIFNSHEEALDHLKTLIKEGYEDAYIVRLKGEERF